MPVPIVNVMVVVIQTLVALAIIYVMDSEIVNAMQLIVIVLHQVVLVK